jgi:hypothetical protein
MSESPLEHAAGMLLSLAAVLGAAAVFCLVMVWWLRRRGLHGCRRRSRFRCGRRIALPVGSARRDRSDLDRTASGLQLSRCHRGG